MKKAILVNDYASVEALNKLFDEGYTVESVDDRGVYVLKRDESKKSANDLHETPDKHLNVFDRKDKDTNIMNPYTKQPHVRIEFDDIRDVPKVWVDGELIGGVNDKPLVSLKVDWNTNTQTINHKGFDINYYDLTGEFPMRRGFREGTPR